VLMMKKVQIQKRMITRLLKIKEVYAHCDIPCGIYDPHSAQIAALTVLRMMDLIAENGDNPRYVAVKEEHAEICKHEIRVIWGDAIKDNSSDDLTHKIMQVASRCKQGSDRKDGEELLDLVNQFAEKFWQSKSIEVKKVKAPYKPEEEIVEPDLQ